MSKISKYLSVFMTLVLLFITVFCNLVITTSAATITTAYIDGSNVRIRSTPTTKVSNIIEKVSGITANVLERVDNSEGTWYKVQYNKDGTSKSGYVFYNSDYIRIVTYNPDADFETQINSFPESYRDSLRQLHSAYPNWVFIPEPVSYSFSNAVADQSINMRKQVNVNQQPASWWSMGLGSYIWEENRWVQSNGGWTGASKEIIAYYMDPRNFLNDSAIYMFLEQGYNPTVQTEDGVRKIIEGTFMENNYTPAANEPGGGSFASVIMLAGKEANVNPYIIASKIRQEQSATSPLITGESGFYNFFNINASGSTNEEVIANGINTAIRKGWDTRYKSIVGGAQTLSSNYISRGQDTYYYQDFNVKYPNKIYNQYAQAVHDAYNKGYSLRKTYKGQSSWALTFKIPIFTDMPASACPKPVSSNKINNYYLQGLEIGGLTPTFSMYNYHYNLSVSGDVTVKATPVANATLASQSTYNLKQGDNTVVITVLSQSGYTTDYTISVHASTNCVLRVTTDGQPSANESALMYGDTNNDRVIDIVDLAKVQMHILGVRALSGDGAKAADANRDGKIDIVDLALVQMHILKVKYIA